MNGATKLAFLGGGHMAWALIQGLLRHGVAASQLRVGEPVGTQRARIQAEFGVLAVAENDVAIRDATLVVLAVKPQQALSVLADLCLTLDSHRPLLLSIVAGTRVAELAACCPDLMIVRAMPNRPALVGAVCRARGGQRCALARRTSVCGRRAYSLGAARVRP